jgi:hypothetical protein
MSAGSLMIHTQYCLSYYASLDFKASMHVHEKHFHVSMLATRWYALLFTYRRNRLAQGVFRWGELYCSSYFLWGVVLSGVAGQRAVLAHLSFCIFYSFLFRVSSPFGSCSQWSFCNFYEKHYCYSCSLCVVPGGEREAYSFVIVKRYVGRGYLRLTCLPNTMSPLRLSNKSYYKWELLLFHASSLCLATSWRFQLNLPCPR